ncbi:cytochrome c oxidase subunit II [Luteibacter aegosomatis]|uniref:cytochrome c oxidase subunit II n=1 Tax=Luteibacter aegosomatis TaxID=2911537 RepID=UPI001FF91B4D|nr:cytochrome c oxidase subunit II [Luteibacter aegosomatis]UPG87677.1 cytochrome c oxidase subunit II [Luteibacter aegosomatis]
MSGLPEASSFAGRIDGLFLALLALCVVVMLAVFVTMVVFAVRFRHGRDVDRSGESHRDLGIEMTWTLIPFALFVGIFAWSIHLWIDMRTPPADAETIYVVGKQWMWEFQHPGGQREIDTLHVATGHPVRLVMTSQDVIHDLSVPAFRVKQDILPGRYTDLWFTATRPGTYDLFCAEYCGTDHSRMGGSVVVETPAAHARWLAAHASGSLAERGRTLFTRYGCAGCHDAGSSVHAPRLEGLYGSTVPLADGRQVTADERYLHDSIVLPAEEVAAGYAPIMPSYKDRIDEADILALLAYLKIRGTERESPHAPR